MTFLKKMCAPLLLLGLSGGLYAEMAGELAPRKMLTLEGAKKVAAAAVAEARKNNAGGVIAIVDEGGQLMYLERLDNTFPAGAMVSFGKARTAALFRKPTKVFEDAIKNGRVAFLGAPEMTPLQGGIPIEADGQVVGGIGVSGANSAAQDEEIAIAGAAALK
jgi:glc operon protein GlcG